MISRHRGTSGTEVQLELGGDVGKRATENRNREHLGSVGEMPNRKLRHPRSKGRSVEQGTVGRGLMHRAAFTECSESAPSGSEWLADNAGVPAEFRSRRSNPVRIR